MADMMVPKIRTTAGDNSSVNPVFGKIAQSANDEKKGNYSAERQDDDANEKRDNEKEDGEERANSNEVRKPRPNRAENSGVTIKKSPGIAPKSTY